MVEIGHGGCGLSSPRLFIGRFSFLFLHYQGVFGVKYYCIINVEFLEPEEILTWVPSDAEGRLNKRYAPTIFYTDKAAAERELLRLSMKYQGEFYLFESIAMAVNSPVLRDVAHVEDIPF